MAFAAAEGQGPPRRAGLTCHLVATTFANRVAYNGRNCMNCCKNHRLALFAVDSLSRRRRARCRRLQLHLLPLTQTSQVQHIKGRTVSRSLRFCHADATSCTPDTQLHPGLEVLWRSVTVLPAAVAARPAAAAASPSHLELLVLGARLGVRQQAAASRETNRPGAPLLVPPAAVLRMHLPEAQSPAGLLRCCLGWTPS